jgi:hypothetical protein
MVALIMDVQEAYKKMQSYTHLSEQYLKNFRVLVYNTKLINRQSVDLEGKGTLAGILQFKK